jgi:hypothetical protein
MRIPDITWSTVSDEGYDEDLLFDIRVGRVVLLIRGRNAWHSTWVRHYLRDSTLFTDVPSAKAGAEAKRGRGNVLYIVEAPALQLVGPTDSIVLCDAHPDNPFGKFVGVNGQVHQSKYGDWVDGVFPGVSMRDAVRAFAHDSGFWKAPQPNEHSLRTGRLAGGINLDARRGALGSFESQSVGVDYYLRWSSGTEGSRYTRRGAHAVVRIWQALRSSIGVEDTDGVDETVAKLVRYRNETLQAIPHALWRARRASEDKEALQALTGAREEWFAQMDRTAELEEALEGARSEFISAKEARMHPAETSAEMRQQRERMEAADVRIRELEAEVDAAEHEAERLRKIYAALSVRDR